MKSKEFYRRIMKLSLEHTGEKILPSTYSGLMSGCMKGNKYEINRLIRLLAPDAYRKLSLERTKAGDYHRTETHLIVERKGVKYFFKID